MQCVCYPSEGLTAVHCVHIYLTSIGVGVAGRDTCCSMNAVRLTAVLEELVGVFYCVVDVCLVPDVPVR